MEERRIYRLFCKIEITRWLFYIHLHVLYIHNDHYFVRIHDTYKENHT